MNKTASSTNTTARHVMKLNPDGWTLYPAMGGVLIPLDGKRPIHKNWTRRRYSNAKVAAKCAAQGRNVGWRIPENVVVLDFDPRNGANAEVLDNFAFEYGFDPLANPRLVRTGGGGWHSFYCIPIGPRLLESLNAFPGIEFKGAGRQVVAAGSIHPDTGRPYEIEGDFSAPMLPLPRDLLRAITRPEGPATITSAGQLSGEQAEAVLARLDPADFRQHDRWLKLMMAIHHATLGDARQEWIDWSISDEQYAHCAEEIGRRWDSLRADKDGDAVVTIGTLRHFLAEAKALDVLPADTDQAQSDFADADDPDFDMSDDSWMEGPAKPEPMLWDMNRANEMLDYAQKCMLDGGAPLYQTGGRVVFPVRSTQASDDESIRRPSGALTVHEVKPPRMQLFMIEHARFEQCKKPPRGGEPTFVKQPATENLAKLCLAAPDLWKFPHLVGIIEAPTLRADGTLLSEAGYDPKSGLLLDLGSTKFPSIPDKPSRQEALAALTLLATPFEGFPFVLDGPNGTSASRSVMLSTVLTGLVRRTLPSAPVHGVSAPTPGTGKSLAVQASAMIVMGRPITAMSQGASEEEDEKRLFSVLMQGDQMVSIDNVTRPIGGDALCTCSTEPTWQNRVLGESRNVSVNTNALITATGNNLVFAGDMTRRALLCRMDAGMENPEGRSFDMDLRTWVPEHRTQLVAAGLTILRAFVCAGRPGLSRLQPFGSFEAWSNLVRGALVWLGEPDPCITRKHIAADDPIKAQLAAFFTAVHDATKGEWFTAGELIKKAEDVNGDETLLDILSAVVPKTNAIAVGLSLKANESKIIRGLTLQIRSNDHKKTNEFKIIKV
jgi:hypothetical protein